MDSSRGGQSHVNGSYPGPGGESTDPPGAPAAEITCQEFVELITDYFEGNLTPRSLRLVEEHLVICDWCVTYTEQMQVTVESLRALREEEPVHQPDPSAEVLSALKARRGASK